MHVCKEQGRISEFLRHSLIMSKDKDEVTGKILNLTLEIIFLLTGEDFVPSKKRDDPSAYACQLCLTKGATKYQSPHEERPCQSSAREEETPKRAEAPRSAVQEVPVRCQDVAVFFSMDEWKYINGHKERYEEVVLENPVSAGGPIPTNPPKSCTNPIVSPKRMEKDSRMMTEESQASPGGGTLLPQCKEEEVPVEICSGGHIPTNPPESHTSPLEEDNRMITEDSKVPPGKAILLPPCKEEVVRVEIGSDGYIPTNHPESHTSPPLSQECPEEDNRMVTEDCQVPPGTAILLPPCKEEDAPVERDSGDPRSKKYKLIRMVPIYSPAGVVEDYAMIPQEYQVAAGDDMLPNRCKEKPNPSGVSSGFPKSWKVQPDSPHILVPVCHKNRDNPSNLEESTSIDVRPIALIVQPKTVLNLIPTLKCETDPPHLFFQEPQVDASSSSLKQGGGDVSTMSVVHECLQCGQNFGKESDLIAHEQLFHCALCQECFLDKSALVVHQWAFHKPKPIVTESQPKLLMKEDGPFTCVECGKSFMQKSNFEKHQKIHTGPFECPDCGKCLTDRSGLIRHRRTHTGEKPFTCSDCGRKFSQRYHLITHQSTHKKSYVCSDCGKHFSVKSILEAHQVFHQQYKILNPSSAEAQLK